MITIKYIPNILKDEGRIIKEIPFVTNKSLKDYLTETEFDTKETRIIVTGRVERDLTISLKNGDEVLIFAPINVFLIPVVMTFWIAVANWTLLVLSILSIAYAIYSFLAAPKTPSFGTNSNGLDEGSPTYGWDGITNTQDVGVPIGVVYGEHRVGGNIINQFIRTDGDKEYLNLLIALSEGEIDDISSVEINENPSANFGGITLTKRYGTNAQAQIVNFNDSHDLKVLSVNLLKNNAYVYTTVNTAITCFELKLTCVGGLYQSDSSGAIISWAVTYQVEYKLHTDVNYTNLGATTIDGKSRTDLRRVFRKEGLTAGQYDIRVTRTSDDSSLVPLEQGDLYLKGVDEITQNEPLIYPNVALLGVEALGTDQLSGSTPTITSLIKGVKVSIPAVKTAIDGAAVAWDLYYWDSVNSLFKLLVGDTTLYWDGTTYVTVYSANPIWCLKDLLSNTRYGLGDYITTSNMDTAQLLEMAKYCEEKVSDGDGGYEKRFRLDVVIDSATKAIDLLTQLSGTFRAFTFYSAGAVKLKIDKVESPVQMFGMGNIISESFMQSWKSIKEIPNVIEVQFMNKDLNYKQDTIAVMDETSIAKGDPIRKKSLRLFCTRTSQAIREGKYALNVAKCIDRTVTLKAGIDAIACQAGDIINVAHDVPAWGIGSGRVQAGSTNVTNGTIVLDQAVTIVAGKTYNVMCRHADDTIETKTVIDDAGTYITLHINGTWTATPLAYDVYSVGELNKVVAPYRIVSMKRAENSEVEITALEYDADVYNTDTIALPDNNYSALTFEIPDVENLTLTERLAKLSDGTIENCIDVWWTRPVSGTIQVITWYKANIYLTDNNGSSWIYLGETYSEHFEILSNLIDGVTYKIAVVSVGYNGKVNALVDSPQETINLIGKSAPPNDVTGFMVKQDGDDLVFSWSPNPDIDLFGYEIREGDTWEKGTMVETDIQHTTYRLPIFAYGVKEYHVKAIDTSRNYSLNAASSDITISKANFIENIGDYDLDVWLDGSFEDSDLNKENITDIAGNQVVDSAAAEVIETGLKGFEITNQLDNNQIVDSSGQFIVDSGNNLVEQIIYQLETFLQLRDFGGYYAEQGIYISKISDLVSKMNARITVNANIQGQNCNSALYIRISDDNITWGGWEVFASGEYPCRYFQIKLIVTTNDTTKIALVFNIKGTVTVRLIFDGNQDVQVVNSQAITFNKSFLTICRVYAIAEGAYECEVSNKTLTGFTATVKDKSTGNPATAKIDWLAQGY